MNGELQLSPSKNMFVWRQTIIGHLRVTILFALDGLSLTLPYLVHTTSSSRMIQFPKEILIITWVECKFTHKRVHCEVLAIVVRYQAVSQFVLHIFTQFHFLCQPGSIWACGHLYKLRPKSAEQVCCGCEAVPVLLEPINPTMEQNMERPMREFWVKVRILSSGLHDDLITFSGVFHTQVFI